jgi:hypothetical protein
MAAGKSVELFDTDAEEPKLAAYFPEDTEVLDLDKVRDQMTLFDRLARPSADIRVVDLAPRSMRRFFELLNETDYVAEATARGVETVICYAPGHDPESFERGRQLRERFSECLFVYVEDADRSAVDEQTYASESFWALNRLDLRITIPRLDPLFAAALADWKLGLREFLGAPAEWPSYPSEAHRSLAYMSPQARGEIGHWLKELFKQIERAVQEVEERAKLLAEKATDA